MHKVAFYLLLISPLRRHIRHLFYTLVSCANGVDNGYATQF